MQIEKSEIAELAGIIAQSVVEALEKQGLVAAKHDTGNTGNTGNSGKTEKTAYQKTEQLLYNYTAFQRIVQERLCEIETIKQCGVPQKSKSIVEYSPGSGLVQGLKLEEETVEQAIASVEKSIEGTIQALELINKCMDTIRNDPYFCILEMRYFQERTQEDIADSLKCSQVTVSKNKNRLIKELSIRLFPDLVIKEMLS